MAVTILKRPTGYILGTEIAISSVSNSSGTALFTSATHSLTVGDFIYIKSTVENYNGFWRVSTVPSGTTFTIEEYSGDTDVAYINTATGTLTTTTAHNWNAVHLPIVYKVSNDRFPNTLDTVRTMTAVEDYNGFTRLTLSGALIGTDPLALDYVKITNTGDYDGVYQIIENDTVSLFYIDLPYSAAVDTAITNANIQFYYNNYTVNIEVWGGLDNGHTYYGIEPYELIATLKLIPDSNGEVKFSISELIKKNIAIKNNLLLGTLPNNLDAFTMFFIKYGESYDQSDGTEITTYTSSYTSDLSTFEGYAVNAKLPFKNVYSGAMSEYVSNDQFEKFLTLFGIPVLFPGKYFDLSFVYEHNGVDTDYLFYIIEYFAIYQEIEDDQVEIPYSDTGVYRIGISDPDCDYDQIKIQAFRRNTVVSAWANEPPPGVPGSVAWIDNGAGLPEVTITLGQASGFLVYPYTTDPNLVQSLYYSLTRTGAGTGIVLMTIGFLNASYQYLESSPTINIPLGSTSGSSGLFDLQLGGSVAYIVIQVLKTSGSGSAIITADSPGVEFPLTENKSIEVKCACSDESISLSWLNYLGGFDYWNFTAYKDHIIDITDSGETSVNVFPEWSNSYGEFADTIRKQTFRNSRKQILVRSQNLTLEQLEGIKYIKTSPLVQIVNSIYDRRTVIVDTDSFTEYKEGQVQQGQQYTISFTISYTDDVPSQKV